MNPIRTFQINSNYRGRLLHLNSVLSRNLKPYGMVFYEGLIALKNFKLTLEEEVFSNRIKELINKIEVTFSPRFL